MIKPFLRSGSQWQTNSFFMSAERKKARSSLPTRLVCASSVRGLENIPQNGPVLFVGNHTVFADLDARAVAAELYRCREFPASVVNLEETGVVGRDFLGEGWRKKSAGDVCLSLLHSGRSPLFFFGQQKSASEMEGDTCGLVWQEVPNFARLALELGILIVPFSALGFTGSNLDCSCEHQGSVSAVYSGEERSFFWREPSKDGSLLSDPGRAGRWAGAGRRNVVRSLVDADCLRFDFSSPVDPAEFLTNAVGERAEALWGTVAVAVERGVQRLLADRVRDGKAGTTQRGWGRTLKYRPI